MSSNKLHLSKTVLIFLQLFLFIFISCQTIPSTTSDSFTSVLAPADSDITDTSFATSSSPSDSSAFSSSSDSISKTDAAPEQSQPISDITISDTNAVSTFLHQDFPTYDYYLNIIDLDTPNLQLVCKLDTKKSFTLEKFAAQTKATYAINTNPFQKKSWKTKTTPIGIIKFNKKQYSKPDPKYSALAFYYTPQNKLRAKIIQTQTPDQLKDYPAAFGGFFTILDQEQIIQYKDYKYSRTAVGLDSQGRYLYILTVISKKITGTSGLSYPECAKILKEAGCTSAIQFDGGHSTALVSPQTGYIHAFHSRKVPSALGFIIP